MPKARDNWKPSISETVDRLSKHLLETSHAIHEDPELAFNEHRASTRLAGLLEDSGFAVARGVGGLETAFRAELTGHRPGPTLAVLAEYDALPEIGHACGHNIIATSAIGAGLALAKTATDFAGKIVVIGTPAEEGGGGKILLAEAGVFADVDAAIMMHPSSRNLVDRGSLANSRVTIAFHGHAAHASSFPDIGINALQAVIDTFNNINSLRLHMRRDARVHGIITHGGDAVNIIPKYARARFSVRARDRAYQRELVAMLRRSAEAAAATSGARLEWMENRGYDNMVANPTISRVYASNMTALGVKVAERRHDERMGSTDMGDISQIVPAVHAYFAIAPEGTPGHSVAFAEAARSPAGDAAVVNAAKAMAMTVADLISDPGLLDTAKAEFQDMQAAGKVAGFDAWREAGRAYPPLTPASAS